VYPTMSVNIIAASRRLERAKLNKVGAESSG
jgi:hypothetical protein